jgi:hypothetical protein
MLGESFNIFTYKFQPDKNGKVASFIDVFYKLNSYKNTREDQDMPKNAYFE